MNVDDVSRDASEGTARPRVDVVVPCFNSPSGLSGRIAVMERALSTAYSARFILVNDSGQPAATIPSLVEAAEAHTVVEVLSPPRNLGQAVATLLGLSASTAPSVVTVDDDGQYRPDDALLLLDALQDTDCVIGVARSSPESWSRLAAARAYHALTMSGLGYPRGTRPTSYRALTRNAIACLIAGYREGQTINPALARSVAQRRFVVVSRDDRASGSSTYSRGDLIRLAGKGVRSLARPDTAGSLDLGGLLAESRWGVSDDSSESTRSQGGATA